MTEGVFRGGGSDGVSSTDTGDKRGGSKEIRDRKITVPRNSDTYYLFIRDERSISTIFPRILRLWVGKGSEKKPYASSGSR